MNEDYQNFDTESSAQEQPQTEQPQSEQPQSSAPETPQYNNEQTYQSYQTYQAYNPYQAQPQHSAPPQKKTPKKKHWGLRIAVVALCCALVGSAAGGAAMVLKLSVSSATTGWRARAEVKWMRAL